MSTWIQYPNLTFNEADHKYQWNGRDVPSVTGMFDRIGFRKDDKSPFHPIGCPDFAKREHDAEFGKAFHKLANAVVIGKNVSYPDEMKPWCDKLSMFMNDYHIEPMFDKNGVIISEYPMYSPFYGYCGTPDFFGRELKSSNLWLIDWKSTGIYQKSFSWQTAGYSMLVRNVFGETLFDKREKIVRVTVLISADRDRPECVFRNYNPEDLIAFQSILNTYKLAA
jgi:hypothetical protein